MATGDPVEQTSSSGAGTIGEDHATKLPARRCGSPRAISRLIVTAKNGISSVELARPAVSGSSSRPPGP